MRFLEIRGGIQIPVSGEEQDLIDLIESQEGQFIKRQDLDERQRELARKMVSRGILERAQREGSLFYVVSGLEDLWR
jgi:hypothetical protein